MAHGACANTACPIHHPKKRERNADASYKAYQDKERRKQAIGYTTNLRTLAAITAAALVGLMKRDLLYRLATSASARRRNRQAIESAR